ncbi:MAG: MauE/DoxX family redox-associated membrane protein [Chthonomonadales bacterium]
MGGARMSAARIVLGGVLLVSAVAKFAGMGVFQAVVALSGIVPGPAVPAIAWAIALAEAAVGALLATGSRLRPALRERALWAAAMLLTTYVTYDLCRVFFRISLPGPYFGIWSRLPAGWEAAISGCFLAAVVWMLGQMGVSGSVPATRGVRQPDDGRAHAGGTPKS